jgi:RNA recognition motif-containing protein
LPTVPYPLPGAFGEVGRPSTADKATSEGGQWEDWIFAPELGTIGVANGKIPFRHYRTKEIVINSKVFVGNLNFETTQDELEVLFSEAGQVIEVFLPADRVTGRPRGFGFVEFSQESEAMEAIERFDGFEFKGRNLNVSEAAERPKSSGFARDDRFSRGPGGRPGSRRKPKSKGSRRNLRARKRGF